MLSKEETRIIYISITGRVKYLRSVEEWIMWVYICAASGFFFAESPFSCVVAAFSIYRACVRNKKTSENYVGESTIFLSTSTYFLCACLYIYLWYVYISVAHMWPRVRDAHNDGYSFLFLLQFFCFDFQRDALKAPCVFLCEPVTLSIFAEEIAMLIKVLTTFTSFKSSNFPLQRLISATSYRSAAETPFQFH